MIKQNGVSLLSWKRNPPRQSFNAATTLGSLDTPTLILPRPGAPEPINSSYIKNGVAMGCSGCPRSGTGADDWANSKIDVVRTIDGLPTAVKVGGALALAYLLHKHLKRK